MGELASRRPSAATAATFPWPRTGLRVPQFLSCAMALVTPPNVFHFLAPVSGLSLFFLSLVSSSRFLVFVFGTGSLCVTQAVLKFTA